MNDGERQYWFNLTEIMSPEQVEKLRDILVRERKKLAEIEAKYGKPKVQLSPEEIAKRNADMEQKKAEQQARLEAKEKEYQQEEADKEAAILAELEGM
jgi:isopropylmalate/homocitrate/citramalate synthase